MLGSEGLEPAIEWVEALQLNVQGALRAVAIGN